MPRITIRIRPALALALLLAVAATTVLAGGAKATADGSLTIHARLCPGEYAGPDFYEECHGTPLAGATFTITAVNTGATASATSGADGNAALPLAEGGYPGPFQITGVSPLGPYAPFVDCLDGADQPVAVEFADSGVATIPDARGEGLVCDWYFSQTTGTGATDGSLTNVGLVCPDEYAGNDYAQDCTAVPPDGTEFLNFVAPSEPIGVAIDGNGIATLPLLDAQIPGDVLVGFSLTGAYNSVVPVIFCLDDAGRQIYPDIRTEQIFIPVAEDGAAITCTWFFVVDDIDSGDEGYVTVFHAACPAGYAGDDYWADCADTPIAGAYFGIGLIGSDVGVLDSTDTDGFAFLPNLADTQPGVLRIYQTTNPKTDSPDNPAPEFDDAVVYCSKDDGQTAIPVAFSSATGREIPAEPADGIRCDWFSLPAAGSTTPTPTAAPVVRLPNTGAETTGDGSGSPTSALALSLSLLGTLAVAMGAIGTVSARRRTPVPARIVVHDREPSEFPPR